MSAATEPGFDVLRGWQSHGTQAADDDTVVTRDRSSTVPALQEDYELLGYWKGDWGIPALRAGIEQRWRRTGVLGVRRLLQMLRRERRGEVLEGAADLLGVIGTHAVGPVLDALEAASAEEIDFCSTLLTALQWMDAAATDASDRAVRVVERCLGHGEPDVRQAACSATASLPPSEARRLLAAARDDEQDEDVLGVIEDELDDLSAR